MLACLSMSQIAICRQRFAASEKKNDQIDTGKLAECLRCEFLPECYMPSTEIRERRRTLRIGTSWYGK
jgi:hypothetical protein